MGEPIWCYVQCRFPKQWIFNGSDGEPAPHLPNPDFAIDNGEDQFDEIKYADCGLYDGEGPDWMDEPENAWVELTFSGLGNYGLACDDLQSFLGRLQDAGVPYIAADESKYEMEGSSQYHGDGVAFSRPSDNDGKVILTEGRFRKLLKEADGDQAALAAITAWFTVPTLATLQPYGLAAIAEAHR